MYRNQQKGRTYRKIKKNISSHNKALKKLKQEENKKQHNNIFYTIHFHVQPLPWLCILMA